MGSPRTDNLQSQLIDETAELEQITQTLETLKQEQEQRQQQVGYSYPQQISNYSLEIEGLRVLLEENRFAKQDLEQETDRALRLQAQAAQATRDQLNFEIRNLVQELHRTREAIVYRRTFPASTPEEQAELDNLYVQLDNLSQQLSDLNQQKSGISSQILAGTQHIQQQRRLYSSEIALQNEQIQVAIQQIQIEMARLRGEMRNIRITSSSLSTQIKQHERNREAQQKRISELHQQIDQNTLPPQ